MVLQQAVQQRQGAVFGGCRGAPMFRPGRLQVQRGCKAIEQAGAQRPFVVALQIQYSCRVEQHQQLI